MKKCILVIFLLIYCVQMYAQKNIHIGLNLINASDITQIKDEGNNFTSQFAYRPGFELRIGHDINSIFSIETGWILKGYKVDFISKVVNPNFIDRFSGFYTSQIPIRLRGRWELPNTSIIISPVLGTRIMSADGAGSDREGNWSSVSTLGSNQTIDYTLNRNSLIITLLAELGTDVEFKVSKRLYLTTGMTYLQGFKSISQTVGTYDFGDGVVHDFSASTRGTYLSLNIGFRYSFSPYWIKPALQEVYERGPQ